MSDDPRASWEDTFMRMAQVLAEMRADCTRRQVGAIIFDPVTGDLIEAGYNGASAGEPGCRSDGACPRGRHYPVPRGWGYDAGRLMCFTCETWWPCAQTAEPGSSYDSGPGTCIALHAEQNAIIRAGRRARGMHLVITSEPCDGCLRLIKGARISVVITPTSEFSVT